MSFTACFIISSILSMVSLSILLPKRPIIYIHLRKILKKSIYIPPGNWFGFMGLSKKNVILSITSELTNEKEIVRKEIKDIKYYW